MLRLNFSISKSLGVIFTHSETMTSNSNLQPAVCTLQIASKSTTLVKTVGTIPVFPHPPIAMLICHSLRNQDPFIDGLHVSTLSGGKGGRKKGSERRKRIGHITMEVCTVNFLLFAQNLTSVPKSFDLDCSYVCYQHSRL